MTRPMTRRVRWMRSGDSGQRGSVTLLGLGFVMVLLFVGGLSIDLWRAFSERRALAELADAAAAAGANGLDVAAYRSTGVVQLDPDLAAGLAWDNATAQSDRRTMVGHPIILVSPTEIVVEVRGEVPLTVLALFTAGGPFRVQVRSEASPRLG